MTSSQARRHPRFASLLSVDEAKPLRIWASRWAIDAQHTVCGPDGGTVAGVSHIDLLVPPGAPSARLAREESRWGIYYTEPAGGSPEWDEIGAAPDFMEIDQEVLRANGIDPGDDAAVVGYIEGRLIAAGFDGVRRVNVTAPFVAAWDVRE